MNVGGWLCRATALVSFTQSSASPSPLPSERQPMLAPGHPCTKNHSRVWKARHDKNSNCCCALFPGGGPGSVWRARLAIDTRNARHAGCVEQGGPLSLHSRDRAVRACLYGTANRGAWWLLFAGILIFSGSLYVMALTNLRWLGAVTPFGGLCFLAGWAWLIIAPK